MLSLITGLPGNGKTLYALQYVAAWAKRESRQVWYHGIKGLKADLGWHELPVKLEKMNGRDVTVPQWWLCPAGSIVLIDEAQMCGFGVRPRGATPEWAQKLEVHRHLGIDVVFITQDPKLLDAHDRSLIELHFHVMRTFGMQRATVHEFRPVRDNIKTRSGSIQHKWKFPKDVFNWYVSAEQHTHKARIPAKVWVLGAIIFLLPLGLWFTWVNYLDPKRVRTVVAGSVAAAPASATGNSSQAKVKSTLDYLREQQPRVAGLAYTAPVYDEVTKPTEAPYPAACVKMGERCGCYSQQATRLDVPKVLCESIVSGGFYVAWQTKAPPAMRDGVVTRPPEPRVELPEAQPVVPITVAEAVQGPVRGRALPKLAPPSNVFH